MPKTNGSGQATTLSPTELDQLLDSAPSPEHRLAWAVMRFTGSRVTETLKLTWAAIHTDRIVFVKATTKTKTTREPLVGDRLREELKRFLKHWIARHGREPVGKDILFAGRYGLAEAMTRQTCDAALRQTCKRLELPTGVSLHSFRRSLATTMVQSGTSLMTVARFTGHASLEQLRRYVDVSPSDELAALEAIS
jgi:site-specific recombinase XerD